MPVALVRHLVEQLALIRLRVVTPHSTTLVVDLPWLVALYPPRGN
jgi:hypothetical protein